MPDRQPPSGHRFMTRLSHAGRPGTKIRGFVNPPVARGSTMLTASIADREEEQRHKLDQAFTYGLNGNVTHHALENVIAEIEGGTRCQIVSTGLAAVTSALLCYLSAGQHCLIPDSAYGPTRTFCNKVLARLGHRDHLLRPGHRRRPGSSSSAARTPRSSTSKAREATPSRSRTCPPSPRSRTGTAPRCCSTTPGASTTSSRSGTAWTSRSRR